MFAVLLLGNVCSKMSAFNVRMDLFIYLFESPISSFDFSFVLSYYPQSVVSHFALSLFVQNPNVFVCKTGYFSKMCFTSPRNGNLLVIALRLFPNPKIFLIYTKCSIKSRQLSVDGQCLCLKKRKQMPKKDRGREREEEMEIACKCFQQSRKMTTLLILQLRFSLLQLENFIFCIFLFIYVFLNIKFIIWLNVFMHFVVFMGF